MMTGTQIVKADRAVIRAFLDWITRRWGELSAPARLELRAFAEHSGALVGRFTPDADGLDMATEWAADMCGHGRNVYAVVNPVKETADPKGANDNDILAAFYLWADCDDDAATANVRRWDGPAYSAAVQTGSIPSPRAHLYWELEEPCANLDAWRALQTYIAAHFASDRSVINPSRIMRVAGTTTAPASKKQAKGYVPELVRWRINEDGEPLEFERALRVWPPKQHPAAVASTATPGAAGGMFDTGPVALDRERAAIAALGGQEWHNHVIRLVASYVSKGLSDAEIHALTDPLTLAGYTVDQTRREVQQAINGARAKGWTPEAPAPVNFDFPANPAPAASRAATGEAPPETWRIQPASEFIAGFVAPEWLVEGIIQRGRLYTFTAPTGGGKTATMLYMATQIASGQPFCGLETEPGDVLFLAGENPDDVRARVIVTLEKHGIPADAARLHFVPGTFSIRADMERLAAAASQLPDLALVVVDTFAAYFDGDDENSNAQALDFARVVRALTFLPSRPAVVMPAHPVKNATRGNLTPKGGSSLLNEVDGNLTAWRDESLVTMHWQGKIRGPDFEPVRCELIAQKSDAVRDRKGRHMPTVIAAPVLEMRAMALADETHSREDRVLLSLADEPGLPIRERCLRLGFKTADGKAQTGPMSRVIDRLAKSKLIRKKHRAWELTKDGEDAVEALRNGFAGGEDLGE